MLFCHIGPMLTGLTLNDIDGGGGGGGGGDDDSDEQMQVSS